LQASLHLRRATLLRGAPGADNTRASRFYFVSFTFSFILRLGFFR
jgi:hypothetical protein